MEKPIVEELKEKQSSEKGAENRPVIENGHSNHGQHEVNGLIQVVGMETTESCANGQPWKHSLTELTSKSSKTNGCPKDISVEEIILPAKVPINSQIFISDTSTRSVAEEPSVILESKVTLNVIPNDSVSFFTAFSKEELSPSGGFKVRGGRGLCPLSYVKQGHSRE